MKIFFTLSLFSILPFCLSSQGITKYMIDEYIESEHLELMRPDGTVANEEVEVLDSVVTQRLDEDIDYIRDKRSYTYDDQARRTQYNDFIWDVQYEQLYQSYQRDYTYPTGMSNYVNHIANNAMSTLIPSSRILRTYGEQDLFAESLFESWDSDSQSWISSQKTILIEANENSSIYHQYTWETAIEDYVISGKSENEVVGLTTTNTKYNIDDAGEFIPDYKLVWIDHPIIERLQTFEFQNYLVETDEWQINSVTNTEFDLSNLSGYTTSKNRTTNSTNGELATYDTSSFQMNLEYQTISSEEFIRISGTTDFYHYFNNAYEYYPNGKIKRRYQEYKDVILFKPYEVIDYYYSSIDVTSVLEELETTEKFELEMPNPASLTDQILIAQLPENEQVSELWVCDQMGKIVQRRKVKEGEYIQLQELGVTSGMYYVSLLGKQSQKTWKIIIQ